MKANRIIQLGTALTGALVIVLIVSWGMKATMSLEDFDRFYKSNEYPAQYEKSIGGYDVKIKVRPSKYHCYRMSPNDLQKADSLFVANDSVLFIDMKIVGFSENSPLFEGDQQELEQRLMYYMTFIKEDLWLESEEKVYALFNHHVERNYNITNSLNIQLAFHKPPNGDFTFVYNDRTLNLGAIKIKVQENDLEKIPHLSL